MHYFHNCPLAVNEHALDLTQLLPEFSNGYALPLLGVQDWKFALETGSGGRPCEVLRALCGSFPKLRKSCPAQLRLRQGTLVCFPLSGLALLNASEMTLCVQSRSNAN
jgi:hypothetical protein